MTTENILSENIQIEPFPMVQLLELSINHQLNDHSYFTCLGIISEEDQVTYVSRMNQPTEITVTKREVDGEIVTFFGGQVLDIQIHNRKNVYYLELKAASSTILLDIQERRRSFQQTDLTYEQLLQQVISPYPSSLFINTFTNNERIGQLTTQYDETTWEFMKRLVSRLGGSLVSFDQRIGSRFYFGLPKTENKGTITANDYQLHHDFIGYQRTVQNTPHQFLESEHSYYSIESRELYFLGDHVTFQGRNYQIIDVKRALTQSVLLNTYVLATPTGATRRPIENEKLKGLSLNGTVQSVRGDQVQVQLDIDQEFNGQTSYWFTYSTSYTSDDNIGWYMMPGVNDRVRVYFPTTDESEAYAISSIREGDNSDLNPAIKTLKNMHGKTITLEPNQITIVGGGTSIVLNDENGVTIKSDSHVAISGKQSISIQGDQILMDAAEQIKLSVHHNSVTIDGQIVLSGTNVKMN